MRVEIDVGNTRLKWRALVEDGVFSRGYLSHEELFSGGLEKALAENVDQIVVSSVANDRVCSEIESFAVSRGLASRLRFVSTEKVMAGVQFAYEDVNRLGVDRCLAMVAGFERFRDGVLVVDCGSAITADFVDRYGKHLGGYILPGIQMLKTALLSGTAKVLVMDETELSMSPGASTEECVEHGRYFQVFSLISGLIEKAKGYEISSLCITGGDGQLVEALLGLTGVYHQDLVFEGMGYVAP